jgi:hypothetical protein
MDHAAKFKQLKHFAIAPNPLLREKRGAFGVKPHCRCNGGGDW